MFFLPFGLQKWIFIAEERKEKKSLTIELDCHSMWNKFFKTDEGKEKKIANTRIILYAGRKQYKSIQSI